MNKVAQSCEDHQPMEGVENRVIFMDKNQVKTMMMAAKAYKTPAYEDFEIENVLEFFRDKEVSSEELCRNVDEWLKSLRKQHPERENFIREVPFPHQRHFDMDNVMRTKGRRLLKAAQSEHGVNGHWWRQQIKYEDFDMLAASMLASFPVNSLPDKKTQEAIMGMCDHFSPATHGEPYRHFPMNPLLFVGELAHYQNWCRICSPSTDIQWQTDDSH